MSTSRDYTEIVGRTTQTCRTLSQLMLFFTCFSSLWNFIPDSSSTVIVYKQILSPRWLVIPNISDYISWYGIDSFHSSRRFSVTFFRMFAL
jgi:hypothetical protein